MKTLKLLTICLVLCCLFSSNVFACDSILADSLGPNGGFFAQGEEICYTVGVSIPNDPNNCSYTDLEVFFFAPDNPPNTGDACTATNGVSVLGPFATFDPGDKENSDCTSDSDLQYFADSADVVNGKLKAQICTKFKLDGEPDSDSKTITSTFLNPDVCVEKTADCDEVLGDGTYSVIYTIKITNCGDEELDVQSINDSLLGDLTNYEGTCKTLPVDANCTFDYTYNVPASTGKIVNVIDVNYVVAVAPEIVVSDFDDEEVKIVNPSFTVDKVCQSPNDYVLVGSDANFVVTVVNDGDVTLDFTSSELGSFTLDPKEKKEEVVKVKTSEADCDGGVENTVSVTGKYVGGKDDCLQWEATVKSSPVAVCKVACPEFEIEKNCLGDVDFDTDPNAYFEIIIRNLGNVPLDFAVTDSNAVFDPPVVFPITIQDGGEKTLTAKIAVLECGEPIVNNVEVIGWYVSEKVWFDIQTDTAECPCEEQGDEGCTPGFWKNSYGCWCGTYKEKDMDQVGEVFEIPKGLDELENDTLLEALKYGGGRGEIGAARNLLRHGVAALLNACSDPVEFKYSEQEVIDKVDIALASLDRRTINDAKDDLAKENERGCPISSDNANEPCTRHDDFDD